MLMSAKKVRLFYFPVKWQRKIEELKKGHKFKLIKSKALKRIRDGILNQMQHSICHLKTEWWLPKTVISGETSDIGQFYDQE